MSNEGRGVGLGLTSWRLLDEISRGGDGAPVAWEEFGRRYREPMLRYILVFVVNKADAEDLVQQFITDKILVGHLIDRVRPGPAGTFRAYLRGALKNFVNDFWRQQQRLRELPIDEHGRDRFLAVLPDAETKFCDGCIEQMVTAVLAQLREEFYDKGHSQHFKLFHGYYVEEGTSWEDIGEPFGLDGKTARNRANTALVRFCQIWHDLAVREAGSEDAARKEFEFVRSGASTQMIRLLNLGAQDHDRKSGPRRSDFDHQSPSGDILAAFGDPGRRALEAVSNPETPVQDLRQIKKLWKKQANAATSKRDKDAAATLYAAAIAAAFGFHGENISSLSVNERLKLFQRLADRLGGDPLAKVFAEAVDRAAVSPKVRRPSEEAR